MHSLFQIDIPKRNPSCCGKGECFLPGMEYYSLLHEDEQSNLQRKDFCVTCWSLAGFKEQFSQPKGYWKSKIEHKKEASSSSKMEKALNLLKELLHSQAHANEAFVLAMFLAHARRLILRQELEREGMKFQLYEVLRHEEFVTVKVVPLTDLEVASIQKSLADKLK